MAFQSGGYLSPPCLPMARQEWGGTNLAWRQLLQMISFMVRVYIPLWAFLSGRSTDYLWTNCTRWQIPQPFIFFSGFSGVLRGEKEEKGWLEFESGGGLTFCLECLTSSGEMRRQVSLWECRTEDQLLIHYSYHTSAHSPLHTFIYLHFIFNEYTYMKSLRFTHT